MLLKVGTIIIILDSLGRRVQLPFEGSKYKSKLPNSSTLYNTPPLTLFLIFFHPQLAHLGQNMFGTSLSLSDDTLAVGGVGYNSSAGAAFVFTVSKSGIFQADQRIEHPDEVIK